MRYVDVILPRPLEGYFTYAITDELATGVKLGIRVLNKYYAEEANDCSIYSSAHFTKNKNEYLPIPYAQIAASNKHYKQNIGQW